MSTPRAGNAWKSCGTENPEALLPDPVHYDCSECRRVIVSILKARKPVMSCPHPSAVQEMLFDDLNPRKLGS